VPAGPAAPDVPSDRTSTAEGTGPDSPRAAGSAAAGALRADASEERVRALVALLAERRRAVLEHDAARWLATVDQASPTFRSRQAAVFANLHDVPFADWSYRYVGPAPPLPEARARRLGSGAWVARVLAGHRLRGYDAAPSYSEQFLTVVRRPGGWLLTADDDGAGAPQPWDLGPVRVERGRQVLVLGTGTSSGLRTYVTAGDEAVDRVTQVWGTRWPRRAVLVAPQTQADFGRLLLRAPAGLDQVAAVTTGDPPAGPRATPPRNDRVVLNPAAFDRLGALGRRVVLTHEITHVAVRSSTTAAVPIWLSEGFADYVAYKGTGVSRRAAAADVLALVRNHRGPTALPTTADFDPARSRIAPSYSASLLACDLVADGHGEPALVRLYRTAATRSPGAATTPDARLDGALQRELGTSNRRFTADWRRYLARLAG
jgi:hypothetical protein